MQIFVLWVGHHAGAGEQHAEGGAAEMKRYWADCNSIHPLTLLKEEAVMKGKVMRKAEPERKGGVGTW